MLYGDSPPKDFPLCMYITLKDMSGMSKVIHVYTNTKFSYIAKVWNKLTKIIKDKDVVMLKGSNSTNLHIVSNNLINLS